ncbi:MAG: hypothetical protein ACOC0X_01130 [Halobacteriota archaeon]
MSMLDDLGPAEIALLGVFLLAAWTAYWLKLRTDAASGGTEADRYLFRTDLAEGGAPRNAVEWVIKLVITRQRLVHAFLVGGSLLGLLGGVLLDEETLVVLFGFLTALFLVAAALFLGAPYLEARLPGGGPPGGEVAPTRRFARRPSPPPRTDPIRAVRCRRSTPTPRRRVR